MRRGAAAGWSKDHVSLFVRLYGEGGGELTGSEPSLMVRVEALKRFWSRVGSDHRGSAEVNVLPAAEPEQVLDFKMQPVLNNFLWAGARRAHFTALKQDQYENIF